MATKTRTTIGQNPLDAVVPDLRSLQNAPSSQSGTASPAPPDEAPTQLAPPPDSSRKERLTIHLSNGLIERLKNAVFWTPGLTLAELGETALSSLVDELEAERESPFPTRTSDLKGGRPLKRP